MKRRLTHGSLFAGIGGFDLGFRRAGFKTVWQVEIERFCQQVLRTHWPHAKLFGDIAKCGRRELRTVDVISGGFPCQDISVAGKRVGLAGDRSKLFYQFVRIADLLTPRWLVVENVDGLLSSNRGKDFACVLGKLTGFFPQVPQVRWKACGVCVGPKRNAAWRVLDSQFFGVAQRRNRVFIVCGPRTDSAFEVLFDAASGERDFAPRCEAGQSVAYAIAAGSGGSKFGSGRQGQDTFVAGAIGYGPHPLGFNGQDAYNGHIVSSPVRQWRGGDTDGKADLVASPIAASGVHHGHSSERSDGCDNLVATTLSAGSFDSSHQPGRRREDDFNLCVSTLNSGGNSGGFRTAPGDHLIFESRFARNGRGAPEPLCQPLKAASGRSRKGDASSLLCAPTDSNRVRNATRISQGLDDTEEALLPKGLDSARYRALGNAVTVQVAEWIGRRIMKYERDREGY